MAKSTMKTQPKPRTIDEEEILSQEREDRVETPRVHEVADHYFAEINLTLRDYDQRTNTKGVSLLAINLRPDLRKLNYALVLIVADDSSQVSPAVKEDYMRKSKELTRRLSQIQGLNELIRECYI